MHTHTHTHTHTHAYLLLLDDTRQEHKSYVCDVNGWSFVKRSPHYFDDCARIIRVMVLTACAPSLVAHEVPIARPLNAANEMVGQALKGAAVVGCGCGRC